MKVFLGGTCNNSQWRSEMKVLLESAGIDYFDPVVDDWTEEDQKRELEEREKCDICLYVLTPKMTGNFSVAEAVDDSNKRPEKTVFVVLPVDDGVRFDEFQMRSMNQISKMIERNGGKSFDSLSAASKWIGNLNKLMGNK